MINLIAAGEVVERPASVIKELVENSIDANAAHIKIYIEEYGTKKIEIHDDGDGIHPEDIENVFEQHATSKISSSKDLNSILTYGFRGEAIASIRSVASKIQLITKHNAGESAAIATATTINKNNEKPPTKGTIIVIHDLFKNVPARKKFLKTANTENRHIKEAVIQFALANPQIHFELHIDDKKIINTPKTDSIQTRIFDLFGNEFRKNLYETINQENNREITTKAFWGNPSLARSRNNEQFIFVNKRAVYNSTIVSAVTQAYQGFIHKSLKPAFILFMDINPSKVDVNVHPRKLEVRFTDPKEVFTQVYKSALNTLQNQSRADLQKRIYAENAAPKQSTGKRISEAVSHVSQSLTQPKTSHTSISQALEFTNMLLQEQDEDAEKTYTYKPLQIFNTYILFQKEDSVIIVDQHAAAEKIAFEKLLAMYGEPQTKPLLVPEIIDLSSDELEIILKNRKTLEQMGFIVEVFGSNSVQVIEIPEILTDLQTDELIGKIINTTNEFDAYYQEYSSQTPNPLDQDSYYLLATTACHGSIRAGQSLSEQEMNNLLQDLYNLENPGNCPHGRPTYYQLEKKEIEKFFKRIL